MTNFLAQQAEKEIAELHEQIKWCLQSSLDKAIEIGEKLSEAKGNMAHGAFDKWVEEKLPFSKRSAVRFINAYIRRKTLKTTGLAYLDSAIKAAKPPAEPKVVEPKPVENTNNEPPPEEPTVGKTQQPIMDTDPGGMVIPENLAEIFESGGLKAYAESLRIMKKEILDLASVNPAYRLIKTNPFTIDIDNCIRALKFAIPYAVCRYCSGSGKGTAIDEDCPCCKNAGWINEVMYKNTPSELK